MIKPFAAFDVDGTIFKSSLLEKVIDSCIDAGIFSAKSFKEVRDSRRRWETSNNEGVYQSYLNRLVSTFIKEIAGAEVDEFNKVTSAMLTRQAVRKFAFSRKLINDLQNTHTVIAISGSPEFLVRPFLEDIGVITCYGSTFVTEGGKFTGEAQSVGDKLAILKALEEDGVITRKGSIAVGDTVSDVSMLAFAETPVMFNASRTLTNHGRKHGWLRVNEVKDQITVLAYDDAKSLYVEGDTSLVMLG